MRYLNRVQSRAEDRYLKARVSLTELGIKAALETLTGRLRDNGVVSFTAQRYTRRPTVVPFLDGEITWRPAPR